MSIARAVGRNTAANLAARAANLLVWFLLTPAILARLGAERFGFWSVLLAFGGSVAALDLGLGVALSRFVAERVAHGDPAGARRMIVKALGLQLAISLTFALAATLAREPLLTLLHVPDAWRSEGGAALVVALFGFAIGVPANLFASALAGLQRMDLYALCALPLAFALALLVWLALGSERPLIGIVLAQNATYILTALALAVVLLRLLARPGTAPGAGSAPPSPGLGRLLRFGGWVQVNAALAVVQANLDKFLIASMVALAPVAAYELGLRIANVALLGPMLALSALLPALAHRAALDASDRRLAFYRRASYPYLTLVGLLVAGMAGLARPLLEAWLGAASADQVLAVRGLAIAGGLSAATGIASTLVRVGDRLALETEYGVLSVVLHVGLAWIGLRAYGWAGAVYGLVGSSLIAALIFVFRVERWLGARPLAEIAQAAYAPVLAAALAAGTGAVVAGAFSNFAPGRGRALLALVTGGAALLVAFAVVLLVASPRRWRELTRLLTLAREPS
jgi:O-antigen/teichoic acid export membrane protein